MTPDWMTDDDAPDGPDLLAELLAAEPPPVVTPPPPVKPAAPAAPFVYGVRVPAYPGATGPVCVEHDVPPGVRVLGALPPVTRRNGRTLTWVIDPTEPAAVRVQAVRTDAGAPTDFSGRGLFRIRVETQAVADVPLFRPAAAVSLAGPERVERGEAAAFRAVVRNAGNCELAGVALTAATEGFELLSEGRLTLAPLPPGGEAEVSVRVVGRDPGRGAVRVELGGAGVTGGASAACDVVAPQLEVTITGPDRWRATREHTVTATVRNAGTAAARLVALRVAVPDGWAAAGDRFVQADRLDPGAALSATLTVRPATPGAGEFRAAAEDDLTTTDATYAATVTLDPADADDTVERFVREVGFAPGEAPPAEADALAGPRPERDHPHVVFAVADTEYALPLGAVREIGRVPSAAPIPGSPGWLRGLANVRGTVVSLVELRTYLGEPAAPAGADARFLLVSAPDADLAAGLVVDRVRGIRSIPPAAVRRPTAPVAARAADYAAGVAAPDGRTVVVLEPARLLLSPEFQPFPPV